VVVLLERTAILPEHPCPDCENRKLRGYSPERLLGCDRCGGKGRIGQRYPPDAVRVDEDGRARWLRGRPVEGEGIYALHENSCPLALAV
jgi:hypothetical protein